MTYVALASLAIVAFLVWHNGRERATHDKTILDLISSNEAERQLLLDRIENPGTVTAPSRTIEPPTPEPDEIERMRLAYESEQAA